MNLIFLMVYLVSKNLNYRPLGQICCSFRSSSRTLFCCCSMTMRILSLYFFFILDLPRVSPLLDPVIFSGSWIICKCAFLWPRITIDGSLSIAPVLKGCLVLWEKFVGCLPASTTLKGREQQNQQHANLLL